MGSSWGHSGVILAHLGLILARCSCDTHYLALKLLNLPCLTCTPLQHEKTILKDAFAFFTVSVLSNALPVPCKDRLAQVGSSWPQDCSHGASWTSSWLQHDSTCANLPPNLAQHEAKMTSSEPSWPHHDPIMTPTWSPGGSKMLEKPLYF